jgi:peptidyl-prolyl cis-trans isomerase D
MTAQEFEQTIREDAVIRKLTTLVEDGVFISDAEADDEYRRQREVCDFDSIQVRYESFLDEVSTEEAELQAHYSEHAEEFSRPEQRVLRYLVVETSRLARLLPVEDSEIEAYYASHGDEFMQGEQAHARHILIRVSPAAGQPERADAKLRAQQVAELARSGADFAELAAKHSDDPANKDAGGDLGWFGRGQMVPEFEQAVFAAAPGEIVGPVESQFGYHVIRLEERREPRQQPLEEVRDKVRAKVVGVRAASEAETRARALSDRLEKERPDSDEAWQLVADEDEAVALNISPPFGREDVVPGIGRDPDLVAAVFDSGVGDVGHPRSISRGWIVWQLKEVHEAGVPPFEDVRARVEQEVRRAKALDLVASRAETVVQRWRAGEEAQVLAEDVGSTVVEVKDHRRGRRVAGVGAAPALDEVLFAAAEGDIVGPVAVGDRGVVVARMSTIQRVDREQLEAARDVTRRRLQSESAQQLLNSILNERQRDTAITVDTRLIERFAPAQGGTS